MRKTTSNLGIAFLFAGLLFTQTAITNSSGVPSPLSGSPQSSGTCANCHQGGSLTSQDVIITTDIPADGFEENTDYTITIKGVGNGGTAVKGGFNATVEDASGFVGSLSTIGGGGAQVGVNAATHTSGNNTFAGDTLVYRFRWNSSTASSATIYTAFNFANGNNGTSGDAVKTETLTLAKNTIGLDELAIETLRIYPNPTNEMLSLELNVPSAKNMNIGLSDLSGRRIQELYNDRASAGTLRLTKNIGNLPAGVYTVTIQYGNQVLHERIVKQ
jgi:hypothetical protein